MRILHRASLLAMGCSAPCLAGPSPDAAWAACATADADPAVAGCTTVIESNAESGTRLAAAYYNRGIARHRQSQRGRASGSGGTSPDAVLDGAIADYAEAIRLRPDYAEAFVNRGIAWYEKGQYDRAIADDDSAIRLRPDLAEAFNNRALAWYRKGRYDRALPDFDQTIRLHQNYGNALINRAMGPARP